MRKFINYIDSLLELLFNRVRAFVKTSIVGLAYFRIIFGFFLLFFAPYFSWIAEAPSSFFQPPLLSLASLFDGFLPANVYVFFDVILIVLFIYLILGIKTRLTIIVTFIILVFLQSFQYSFGKIDHFFLALLALLTLAFTNSGTYLALVKDKEISEETQQTSLGIFALTLCFGMVTAGLRKFFSWIDFDIMTSGILSWHTQGYFSLNRQAFLASYIHFVPNFLLELGDYTAAVLEMSGIIFLLTGARAWRFWLFALCFFHFINVLVLNIPFLDHVIVYSVFLLPNFFHEEIAPIIKPKSFWIIMIIVASALAINNLVGRVFYQTQMYVNYLETFSLLQISFVLWLSMALLSAYLVFKRP